LLLADKSVALRIYIYLNVNDRIISRNNSAKYLSGSFGALTGPLLSIQANFGSRPQADIASCLNQYFEVVADKSVDYVV